MMMDLSSLPEEIAELTHLESLDVGHNKIATWPPEISKIKSLRELDISSNLLMELPPELTDLPNLVELDISMNEINEIPPWIRELGQLQSPTQKTIHHIQPTDRIAGGDQQSHATQEFFLRLQSGR